jgi:hypothetical protein
MIRPVSALLSAPMMLVLATASLGLNACSLVSKAPDLGSVAQAANPLNWFGGSSDDDGEAEDGSEIESEATEGGDPVDLAQLRPASTSIGMVHMVDARNGFLLIRSSRVAKYDYGSQMISHGSDGRQTAELKLSPERKGAFLVADIIKGNPDVGDTVKLVGASDPGGVGIIPVDSGQVQVLE